MLDVKGIKYKALKWWNDGTFLKSCIQNTPFFPKDIPNIGLVNVSKIHETYNEVINTQDELRNNSKNYKGFGYSLEWEQINYRVIGKNEFIKRIYIESEIDYLKLISKEKEFKKFVENVNLITTYFPELQNWLLANSIVIIQNSGVWEDLIKVCFYFKNEHQPDRYYIRELPINVHTKFIEEHKTVISNLLDALIPEKINQSVKKNFCKRYYLKDKEKLIRVRLLCPVLQENYYYQDFSIRLSDFTEHKIPALHFFIAENEINFLTLPQKENSIALWSGGGFQISYLANIEWLKHEKIYYWGDIDAAGLAILSQLKTYYPSSIGILMDRSTFDKYYQKGTCERELPIKELASLSKEELALYHFVNDNKLRLEQERIPQMEIVQVMNLIK